MSKQPTATTTKATVPSHGLDAQPWEITDGAGYLICFRDAQDNSANLATVGGRRLGGHYLGIAPRTDADESPEAAVFRRLSTHQDGRGARITQVAVERGLRLEVVRTWESFDRETERKMKKAGHFSTLCPRCRDEARKDRNAKARARYAAKAASKPSPVAQRLGDWSIDVDNEPLF